MNTLPETALEKYNALDIDLSEPDPIERLRFFLSLSLKGQDWLDVEKFIDDLQIPDGYKLGDIVSPSKSVCDKWPVWKPTDLLKIVGIEYKSRITRIVSDEINYTMIELSNPDNSLSNGWTADDFQAPPINTEEL